ncbi:MAG: DUF11 domain-containing protein, partial [Solirubrobacterales bacterium]
VSDPLPPGLTYVSSGDCNAVMTCSLGTILSGETRTVEIIVETGPAVAGTTVVNTATVSSSEFDPNPDDNTSTAETAIDTLANISVEKTGPAEAQADSRIIWNIVVANSGPNPAQNVSMNDVLPPEVTNPSVTTSQGSCDVSIACSLGSIPVDGSVLITVEADIPRGTVTGTVLVNYVEVSTTTDEIDPDDNSSSWDTGVTPYTPYPADVGILKEADSTKVKVGDIVVFGLTATNSGEVAANNVVIRDTLSPKLRYISSSIPGGKCTERNATVTCRRDSLAGGASVTARIKVRTIATGKIANTTTINASNSTISIPKSTVKLTVVKGKTTLAVTKKANRRKARAGSTVKYRIQVRNRTTQAAVDVEVCDRIPAGTTVISTGGGKLDRGRVCWSIDYLPGKGKRNFRIKLRIDRFYASSSLKNVVTAKADNTKGVKKNAAKVGVIKVGGASKGGGVTG